MYYGEGYGLPYSCLSNMHPAKLWYKGYAYGSAECALQAQRAADPAMARKFARGGQYASGPDARRAAGHIPARPDWDSIKDSVMLDILRKKFRDRYFAEKLLATGDAPLREEDAGEKRYPDCGYWGICCGRGQNRFGELLMQVRNELRKEKEGRPC